MKKRIIILSLLLACQIIGLGVAFHTTPMATIERLLAIGFIGYLNVVCVFTRMPIPYLERLESGDEQVYFEGYLNMLEDVLRITEQILRTETDAETARIRLGGCVSALRNVKPPLRYRKRHQRAIATIEQAVLAII